MSEPLVALLRERLWSLADYRCRTVYEVVTGEPLGALPLQEVRGLEGVKEATVPIKPNPQGPLHNAQVGAGGG